MRLRDPPRQLRSLHTRCTSIDWPHQTVNHDMPRGGISVDKVRRKHASLILYFRVRNENLPYRNHLQPLRQSAILRSLVSFANGISPPSTSVSHERQKIHLLH